MEVMTMRILSLLGLATLAALPSAALAHAGHAHKMMGTITAVHADMKHVEIKTTGGKTDGFYVSDATKYLQGSKAIALSDLKPGQRVVVTATMEGDKMMATTVRLSAGGKTSTAKAAKPAAHRH
jgi:hypothetical protein